MYIDLQNQEMRTTILNPFSSVLYGFSNCEVYINTTLYRDSYSWF